MHNAAGDLHMPNGTSSPTAKLIQRQDSLIKEVSRELATCRPPSACQGASPDPPGGFVSCQSMILAALTLVKLQETHWQHVKLQRHDQLVKQYIGRIAMSSNRVCNKPLQYRRGLAEVFPSGATMLVAAQ